MKAEVDEKIAKNKERYDKLIEAQKTLIELEKKFCEDPGEKFEANCIATV